MNGMLRMTLGIVASALSLPLMAMAQDSSALWSELPAKARKNSTLVVLGRDGSSVKGRLLEISADSLLLLIDGQTHQVSAANVSEISRRQHDSVLDGVVKGASWGGAIAAGGLVAAYFSNNQPHGCPCGSVLAATMGAGALIGFALDAAVSDTVVIYHTVSASQGRTMGGNTRATMGIGWRF